MPPARDQPFGTPSSLAICGAAGLSGFTEACWTVPVVVASIRGAEATGADLTAGADACCDTGGRLWTEIGSIEERLTDWV